MIAACGILRDDVEWPEVLSPRECEIAILVAGGLSNKQVARELGLSPGTVKVHVHSILRKLGATRRHSLIFLAKAPVPLREDNV